MKRMEDGRYNKVANIIGHHHAIPPARRRFHWRRTGATGTKRLAGRHARKLGHTSLRETRQQPPRYIEGRLSTFALEVAFNPKRRSGHPHTTQKQRTGSASHKIPPVVGPRRRGYCRRTFHQNSTPQRQRTARRLYRLFKRQRFHPVPRFHHGRTCRLQQLQQRSQQRRQPRESGARITKLDRRTLAITELPYGQTTESLIRSIIAANDKGRIRVRKIDDNTADQVEILIHLAGDVSPDKTIDALYAFTRCEVTLSPDACVIMDGKPFVLPVEDMLRYNADRTRHLLKQNWKYAWPNWKTTGTCLLGENLL